jgi:hypothetical protein
LASPAGAPAARDADDATRSAVRQDFARYRCAGYNPVADEINYPADIEAARDRLQRGACQQALDDTSEPAGQIKEKSK